MVFHKPMDDVRVGLPLMATETVTKQVDISTLHVFSCPQQKIVLGQIFGKVKASDCAAGWK